MAHIKATFNNTTVTIADTNGDVLCWATAGTMNFKGSRKSTPYAAQRAAESCAERAAKFGVKEMEVKVKGPGSGRESAITGCRSRGCPSRASRTSPPCRTTAAARPRSGASDGPRVRPRHAEAPRSPGVTAYLSRPPHLSKISSMRIRWRGLELPSSVTFDRETLTDTYCAFHVEPFERGFGHTIGNSLRRILLSSLEGSAVSKVKLQGVQHEFSTIPGVAGGRDGHLPEPQEPGG